MIVDLSYEDHGCFALEEWDVDAIEVILWSGDPQVDRYGYLDLWYTVTPPVIPKEEKVKKRRWWEGARAWLLDKNATTDPRK